MKIVIYWNNENATKLLDLTKESLDWIGLSEFISIETNDTNEYKEELWIKSDNAFCVEEDSIDFKDVIFEWQVPSKEELDSLLISLIGWESHWGCSEDWCSGCHWGC